MTLAPAEPTGRTSRKGHVKLLNGFASIGRNTGAQFFRMQQYKLAAQSLVYCQTALS